MIGGLITGLIVWMILRSRDKYPPCPNCGHVAMTHWKPDGHCRAGAFSQTPCECEGRTPRMVER